MGKIIGSLLGSCLGLILLVALGLILTGFVVVLTSAISTVLVALGYSAITYSVTIAIMCILIILKWLLS